MAALVDTNILVHRYDPRFPDKQAIATEVLGRGIAEHSMGLPHQAVVEFMAAVTRPLAGTGPLLEHADALREAEDLLVAFPIVYPSSDVVRTALRGAAAYRIDWFDAHLRAHAEVYGFGERLPEDFQHDRLYGTVRVINPFLDG
ncbi:MAG TPA: PIN domain-containing protein [Longimicrobiales bacterium]